MYALNNDFFYDIDGLTDVIRPRKKTLLDRLVGRYASGQILSGQFLYEVHGPFDADAAAPVRRPVLGRLADRLKALASDMAHRNQLRRAALDMSRLDDRMLKDIGITRTEIEAAVSGALTFSLCD
ncbi:DUF1127 domain-containing protein [Bosea sp. (in: a-proteobacteria)]|jgi:uncharacterized protein YjiS (DUF1127 family)|uniref:DUF1127 domain-containing protein n=1 Tax=Bosea sp. (in: a-proteobacteria) TaxID=1871050 RepID=UPI003F70E85C